MAGSITRKLKSLRAALSPLDLYRHEPAEHSLSIRMDITNRCNLRCRMCHYGGSAPANIEPVDMSPGLFRKIADEIFPLSDVVVLSCQYEPFMSPHAEEILKMCHGVPRGFGLVTNATMLTEKRAHALIDNQLVYSIAVSIDGGTKETFEYIRRGANRDRVLRNVENLIRIRGERGSQSPVLQVNTIAVKKTIRELPMLVDLITPLDAKILTVIPCGFIDPYLEDGVKDWAELMPLVEQAKAMCLERGIHLMLPSFLGGEAQEPQGTPTESACHAGHCEAPWNVLQIHANGDVYPCAAVFNQPLGNISTQSFSEIWNGEPYLRLRRELVFGTLRPCCLQCKAPEFDNLERRSRS